MRERRKERGREGEKGGKRGGKEGERWRERERERGKGENFLSCHSMKSVEKERDNRGRRKDTHLTRRVRVRTGTHIEEEGGKGRKAAHPTTNIPLVDPNYHCIISLDLV